MTTRSRWPSSCSCATPSWAGGSDSAGTRRLGRIFNESACVDGYRDLLLAVAGGTAPRSAASTGAAA